MLRDLGFRYFFVGNEETSTWAQIQSSYVRQGMHEIKEYASYLSLMNAGDAASQAGMSVSEAEESAAENLPTNVNGALELVGEALQPVASEEQGDVSAGEMMADDTGSESVPEEGSVTEENW